MLKLLRFEPISGSPNDDVIPVGPGHLVTHTCSVPIYVNSEITTQPPVDPTNFHLDSLLPKNWVKSRHFLKKREMSWQFIKALLHKNMSDIVKLKETGFPLRAARGY